MTDNFPSRQIRSLLLEHLREEPSGSYHRAANGVARLAINMGLLAATLEVPGDEYSYALSHQDSRLLRERVRQELWLLLSQGILVFGKDEDNPSWPWYRLTEYGGVVVQQQGAQPYDPDGFLTEFAQKNPEADPVIGRYIEEAVRTFNHGCPIAASVMIGGASEKAILVLVETFEAAIADQAEKTRFQKSQGWTIHSKYKALRDRLDLMVAAKTLPRPLNEYVASELPGAFELIRRLRNSAGHPELYTEIDPDTVFLNLRIFSEYIRKVNDLIAYFEDNPANW